MSPHSARVPALRGEKYEVTKEVGSADSPALNGPCPRGKAGGRAGWCLRKSSVDADRPRPARGKGRGLRVSPAPEAPQGMGRPTGPTEAGVGGERRERPLSLGEVAVPQGVFASLCSLRCQGNFKYAPTSLPALVSLVSRRRGEALPPLRHLAPPLPLPRHLSLRGATQDRGGFSHPPCSCLWCSEAC